MSTGMSVSSARHVPKNNTAIDLVKFICSLLIVVIHTSPLEHISVPAHFFVHNILTRVAVPLFYAVSGFLFFGKLDYRDGKISEHRDNFRRLLTYCKRNVTLYLIWSAVYLVLLKIPMWYRVGWWGLGAVKDLIVSLFFSGMHYHLWYLLAAIYAFPLLYGLLRVIPLKKVCVIAALLWVCECLTYSYSWIGTDGLPAVSFISSRMPIIFDTLFRAIPLLAVGAVIALDPPDWSQRKAGIFCLAAFLLCASEATALYIFSPNKTLHSYLIFTPFLAFSWLFNLIQSKRNILSQAGSMLLRNMSLTIYCMHPLVIEAAEVCGVPDGILKWLAVSIVSVAIAAACAWYKARSFKRKKSS